MILLHILSLGTDKNKGLLHNIKKYSNGVIAGVILLTSLPVTILAQTTQAEVEQEQAIAELIEQFESQNQEEPDALLETPPMLGEGEDTPEITQTDKLEEALEPEIQTNTPAEPVVVEEPEQVIEVEAGPSCTNPGEWQEITDQRTENSRTFYVAKEFQKTRVDGQDVYQYFEDGEVIDEIPADDFLSSPYPERHPTYFNVLLCSHTEDIHYKNPSTGLFEEIDTSIYPNQSGDVSYEYVTGAHSFKVHFGYKEGQDIAKFVSPDISYAVTSLTIDGQPITLPVPSVVENRIIYPEILAGVDLQFMVQPHGLNKFVTIKNEKGLAHNFDELSFGIASSRDLSLEDGAIKADGLEEFTLLKPYTQDASQHEGVEEEFELTNEAITIFPSQEYLRSEERDFPILIDPGADIVRRTAHDTFVRSNNRYANYGIPGRGNYWFMSVGRRSYDTSTNAYLADTRSFLSFNMEGIGDRSVRKAHIQFQHYNTYNGAFSAQIYGLGRTFNEADVTWNRQPHLVSPNAVGHVYFPFTNVNGHGNTRTVQSSDIRGYIEQYKYNKDAVFALKYDESRYRGAIFCSKDQRSHWGHPCSVPDKGPVLSIWLNNKPLTPVARSTRAPGQGWQDNNHISSKCDASRSDKQCTVLGPMAIAVENINGGEGDSAYNRILGVDYVTDPDHLKELTDFGHQRFFGRREQDVRFANGIYRWHTQSKDDYGEESDLSAPKTLIVDSQAPVQIGPWEKSDNQVKGQLDVRIPEYADNLIGTYRFFTEKDGQRQYLNAWSRDKGHPDHINGDRGNIVGWVANDGARNQLWTYSSLGLIRGIGGYCMTAGGFHAGANVYLDTCHTGSANRPNHHQIWVLNRDGGIQLSGTQMCVDTQQRINEWSWNIRIDPCDANQRDQVFEYAYDEVTRFVLGEDRGLSLDATGQINDGKERIVAAGSSNHPNLKFRVLPGGLIQSQGQHKRCLKTMPEQRSGELVYVVQGVGCDRNDPNQLWNVHDTHIQMKVYSKYCMKLDNIAPGSQITTVECDTLEKKQSIAREWFYQNDYPGMGLYYKVQIAKDIDFKPESIMWDQWQKSRDIQFACADAGLENCLRDGEDVFVRVQAADNVSDDKANLSTWSSVYSFNPDFTRPVITDIDHSTQRIKPTTKEDTSNSVTLKFQENRVRSAYLRLTDESQEREYVLDRCIRDGAIRECGADYLTQNKQAHFALNGFDSEGKRIPSGVYSITPVVVNDNGITSDDTLSPTSSIVIDDQAGYIVLKEGFEWNTHPNPIVQGYINSSEDDEDNQNPVYSDIRKIEYALDDGQWRTLPIRIKNDQVQLKSFSLPLKISQSAELRFRITDSLGNQSTVIGAPGGQQADTFKINIDTDIEKARGQWLREAEAVPTYSLLSTPAENIVGKLEKGTISSQDLEVWKFNIKVAEGTEYVSISTSPYTGALPEDEEEPENNNSIGFINAHPDQSWFTSEEDIVSYACENSECIWEFEYNPRFEEKTDNQLIQFKAYQGGVVQETLYQPLILTEAVGVLPQEILVTRGDNNQPALKNEGTYYTNGDSFSITGVAQPGIELTTRYKGQTQTVKSSEHGLWSLDLDIAGDDQRQSLVVHPTSIPEFKLKLDLVKDSKAPELVAVKTTNISQPLAISPWAQKGDKVQFEIRTNEPLLTAFEHSGVYGELRNEANIEAADQQNTYIGDLVLNSDHQGLFWTYIKVSDLAGNKVFYSNDPEMKEKNIDLQDDEDQYPQKVISIPGAEYKDGKLSKLPEYVGGREPSLDFTLWVDALKTRKHDLAVEGWNVDNGIRADGVLPEVDRLNTQQEYVLKNTCFGTENPANDCPQPVHVFRGDRITINGKSEQKQRAVVRVTKGNGLEIDNRTEATEYLTVNTGSSKCSQSDQDVQKGIRGLVTTRYNQDCQWSLDYEFEDDGLSPQGIPYNYYVFDFYTIDGAGNLAGSCDDKEGDFIDRCGHFLSNSVTIYHDTEKPFKTNLNEVLNPEGQPIGGITRDTRLQFKASGESRADVEIRQKVRKNQSGADNQTNLSDQLNRIKEDDQTRSFLPVNSFDDGRSLIASHQEGEGIDIKLDLGDQSRDDARLDDCTRIDNNPIKNRRVGICNDGQYTTTFTEFDSAGNRSETIEYGVERDTVRPDAPKVNLETHNIEYDLYETLGLKIEGEARARAMIEVVSSAGSKDSFMRYIPASGVYQTKDILGRQIACGGATYTITVVLYDRAGNAGVPTTVTIQSKPCPTCTGVETSGDWVNPIQHPRTVITSPYGPRNGKLHKGIDIGVGGDPNGVVPILSVKSGKVTYIGTDQFGGHFVDVEHSDGYKSRYVHLFTPANNFVSLNQQVPAGFQLGLMGSTGNSTGPHLHLEIYSNGSIINPNNLFYQGNGNVNSEQAKQYFCNTTSQGIDVEEGDEDSGSDNQGNGSNSGAGEFDDSEDFLVPSESYIEKLDFELYEPNSKSFNDAVDSMKEKVDREMIQPLSDLPGSVTTFNFALCYFTLLGDEWNKFTNGDIQLIDSGRLEDFVGCIKEKYGNAYNSAVNIISFMMGIYSGRWQWVKSFGSTIYDLMKFIAEINSPIPSHRYKAIASIMAMANGFVDGWNELMNFLDKTISSRIGNFSAIMSQLSLGNSDLSEFVLALKSTDIWNDPGRAADYIDAVATGMILELKELAMRDLTYKVGTWYGYISLEIATEVILTITGSRAAKIADNSADSIRTLDRITDVVEMSFNTTNKPNNRFAWLMFKGDKALSGTDLALDTLDGGIGIKGSQALDLIKSADQAKVDELADVVRDSDKADVLLSRKWIHNFCPANNISLASVSNSSFNIFALFQPVQVNAQSGSRFICNALAHIQSHWREKHFDITDEQLKNRALGVSQPNINGIQGQLASKFTISEKDVNNIITKNLRSRKGKDFVANLDNLNVPAGRGYVKDTIKFTLDKSIGYGYVSKNGVTVDKVNNLKEITVVFAKNRNGEVFILSSYPSKLKN